MNTVEGNMCCKLDTCCFCIDLKGGVKALGLILALLSLLTLIFSVVQLENQRQDWLACAAKAKDLSTAENEIKCESSTSAEIIIQNGKHQANNPKKILDEFI